MKFLILLLILAPIRIASSKESKAIIESLREYNAGQRKNIANDVPPEKFLADLIARIPNVPEPKISPEEILSALSSAKESPSPKLVTPLKELWSYYRTSTFRTVYPDEWRYVKGLDFSQIICDEIKILVEKMGGSLDDIEPLGERNTYKLKEILASLDNGRENSQDGSLSSATVTDQTNKFLAVIRNIDFNASNEDEQLQLFYIAGIIRTLGVQKTIGPKDPIISVFDEILRKSLIKIDGSWTPSPFVPGDETQPTPNAEEKTQQWKRASRDTHQGNLRRIRDLILTDISNLIDARKSDDAFKQEMLKRFAKDDSCRKFLEAGVSGE